MRFVKRWWFGPECRHGIAGEGIPGRCAECDAHLRRLMKQAGDVIFRLQAAEQALRELPPMRGDANVETFGAKTKAKTAGR